MNGDYQPIVYQGPEREYVPYIDTSAKPNKRLSNTTNPVMGYYDLDYLLEALKAIKKAAMTTYSEAERILVDYSVKVDLSDTTLVQAHETVYPNDTTPGHITFDEYKYLSTVGESSSVQYVKSYYEKKMRGPRGVYHLDLAILLQAIYHEAVRIENFIDTYIGELDETAEYRTIELFQDWTEESKAVLERIKKKFKAPNAGNLPQSELDRIDSEVSGSYQQLLQTKLNNFNKLISDSLAQLEKNWNAPSANFYDKKLGPGLLFQIKAGKTLTSPGSINPNQTPVLANELNGVISSLSTNFTISLKDMMTRNEIFVLSCKGVLNNLDMRDTYNNYMLQLAVKGKKITDDFITANIVDQAEVITKAKNPLTNPVQTYHQSTSVRPSHSDLMDRHLDNAHDQYLLRKGDFLEGDISVKPGVKFDGVDISDHAHTGKDGTPKIQGKNIENNSITDDNVSVDPTTVIPQYLEIAGYQDSNMGTTVIDISFEVGSQANIVNYEFEIIKLSGAE